jgi:hypothetical protein
MKKKLEPVRIILTAYNCSFLGEPFDHIVFLKRNEIIANGFSHPSHIIFLFVTLTLKQNIVIFRILPLEAHSLLKGSSHVASSKTGAKNVRRHFSFKYKYWHDFHKLNFFSKQIILSILISIF